MHSLAPERVRLRLPVGTKSNSALFEISYGILRWFTVVYGVLRCFTVDEGLITETRFSTLHKSELTLPNKDVVLIIKSHVSACH